MVDLTNVTNVNELQPWTCNNKKGKPETRNRHRQKATETTTLNEESRQPNSKEEQEKKPEKKRKINNSNNYSNEGWQVPLSNVPKLRPTVSKLRQPPLPKSARAQCACVQCVHAAPMKSTGVPVNVNAKATAALDGTQDVNDQIQEKKKTVLDFVNPPEGWYK